MTAEQLLSEVELLLSPTVTLSQAAKMLEIKPRSVLDLVYKKKIGAFKPGGRGRSPLYFDRAEIERYRRQNRIKSDLEIESEASTYTYKRKSA